MFAVNETVIIALNDSNNRYGNLIIVLNHKIFQYFWLKAAMVDYWGTCDYLGMMVPLLVKCLKALTPEQVEQHIANRIPNADRPKVNRRKNNVLNNL